MLKRLGFALAATLGAWSASGGDFAILPGSTLQVEYRQRPVVVSDCFRIGDTAVALPVNRTEEIGGDTAANSFGEVGGIAFRRETVVRDGGREIEISFQAQVPAYNGEADGKTLSYEVVLPLSEFTGSDFVAVTGRSSKTEEIKGKITDRFNPAALKGKIRWLALTDAKKALVFDCDPGGINAHGDYGPNAIIGMWAVKRDGDHLVLSIAYAPKLFGGDMTGKLVIHAAEAGDYDRRHAHRAYSYFSPLQPDRQYVFGATKFGKNYTDAGTTAYSAEKKAGWLDNSAMTVRNFAPEGACYSAVAGAKPAIFRVSDLRSGLYLVTLTAGNGKEGEVGPWSLNCDGRNVASGLKLAPQSVTVINFPAWIEDGDAELKLEGSWQLSTLDFQLLQASPEDYTFRRGFWKSDKGPYPSVLRRSPHYAEEPAYSINLSSYPLPEEGKEAALPRKAWTEPTSHAEFQSPDRDWRGQATIGSLGPSNNGTFAEFDTPELLARRMKELGDDQINILLLNGFLSRHTYPAHLPRVEKTVTDIVNAGHARGMKILDHQDYSLLWNMDSGFRVLVENMDKLQQTIDGNLVARGFCPVNPAALDSYMDNLARYIRATGIDGIMIDETCFHGLEFCGCAACRKAFKADTDWELPANELSKDLNNKESALWRTWLAWRQKKVGDFWYEVKKRASAINPEFVVMGYTTHYGMTSTYGSLNQGNALEQLARTWDFIGTEIMSRNIYASYRSVQAFRKAKNQYRNSADIPVFGLVYSDGYDWNVLYFGWALNNMNGQTTWEMTGVQCPEGQSNYRRFTREKGNMNLLKAEPRADIALVFSNASRDWPRMAAYPPDVFGTSQLLSARHIQHEFLNESGLRSDALKKFKVLFLNNAMALDDAAWNGVKQFVKDGGTLYLSGRTGMADEAGTLREHFPPADFFPGLSLGQRPVKCREFVGKDGKIIKIATPVYGAEFLWQDGKPQGEVMMTAVLSPKVSVPALLRIACGKGQVYLTPFLFGNPAQALEVTSTKPMSFDPQPDAEALYYTVMETAGIIPNVWNPVAVPEAVLTSVYRDGKNTMVHFLNATGSKFKKGEIVPSVLKGNPYPAPTADIVFELPGKFTEIYAASPDFEGKKPLSGKHENGVTRVTLPKELLKVYTIVHLIAE